MSSANETMEWKKTKAKRAKAYQKVISHCMQAIEACREIENNILCDKMSEDLEYAMSQYKSLLPSK